MMKSHRACGADKWHRAAEIYIGVVRVDCAAEVSVMVMVKYFSLMAARYDLHRAVDVCHVVQHDANRE